MGAAAGERTEKGDDDDGCGESEGKRLRLENVHVRRSGRELGFEMRDSRSCEAEVGVRLGLGGRLRGNL
jgi:hypothetical protein